jgi:hypothetical protein
MHHRTQTKRPKSRSDNSTLFVWWFMKERVRKSNELLKLTKWSCIGLRTSTRGQGSQSARVSTATEDTKIKYLRYIRCLRIPEYQIYLRTTKIVHQELVLCVSLRLGYPTTDLHRALCALFQQLSPHLFILSVDSYHCFVFFALSCASKNTFFFGLV